MIARSKNASSQSNSSANKRGRHLRHAVSRWLETLEPRQMMAAVMTDRSDYAFGSTALITGAEFAPLETVQLQVVHPRPLGCFVRRRRTTQLCGGPSHLGVSE